jgi:predicted ATP-dependent protease
MPEVSEAVSRGEFHVWTVERVEDAIELLTGLPAGAPDAAGDYPEDSLYGRVARQLAAFDEGLAERRLAPETPGPEAT